MRFTAKQDNLVALEYDLPGGPIGETVLTIEEAKALRDQLDRAIDVQERG